MLLSVIIPLCNHDRRAAELIRETVNAVAPLVPDYEIVIVDNGSTDEQFADYDKLLGHDGISNLQIYRLIQRVEYGVAAWAGVENSLGDYVLVYNPRDENLSRLADALEEIDRGREVVYLRNTAPTDAGLPQRIVGPLFRWSFRRLTGIDLTIDATPGRLISKRVVSYLLQQPRPSLRYRALPSISGFSKTTLTYTAERAPDPSHTFARRARAALNLVVSNSIAPLRIVSAGTLAAAALNVLYSLYVVGVLIVKRDVAPGWTTLSLQISGMFFLLSVMMFVMIEYLIHMIRSSSHGPSYFLASEATSAILTRRQKLNVEEAGTAPLAVGVARA